MLVASLLLVLICFLFSGIHKIEEGHVGIYYRNGVLSPSLSSPGYNIMIPLITSVSSVQISVQTDQVTEIPCGTSGGVMIYFDKIEVVNRLKREYVLETVRNYTSEYDKIWIYDKIHHEINQFCSQHTLHEVFIEKFETLDEELIKALETDLAAWVPGLEILSIRVTKPRIPSKIKSNFETMEAEKTRFLIVNETQKLRIQESETKRRQALIKARSDLEVMKIEMTKKLKFKENELKIAKMETQMFLDREKGKVDAEFYRNVKELETIQGKLTPEFLKMSKIKAMTSNLVVNVGDSIPNIRIGDKNRFEEKE